MTHCFALNSISYKDLTIFPVESVDYWKLMEDGSLVKSEDGWLKDPNGNYILDGNGERIGAEGMQSGLQNIMEEFGVAGSEYSAYQTLVDQGFENRGEEGGWWNHEGNAGMSITLDNEQYRSVYENGLDEHNTLNIYNRLAADGRMVNPQYDAVRRALGQTIADETYGSRNISYDQYKENNFIQGSVNVQFGRPVATSNEISTLFAAQGNLSNYPHRGIDWATASGNDLTAMLWNDQTTVSFANYGNQFANTAQGNMVGLETVISSMYKGQMREDTVLHRYMHLNDQRSVTAEIPSIASLATIIGQTGNSGQWNGAGYGAHLHADVSVDVNRSPYLDQMAWNYQSPRMTSYQYPVDQRIYYDPMMFFGDAGYTVRPTAGGYNSW